MDGYQRVGITKPAVRAHRVDQLRIKSQKQAPEKDAELKRKYEMQKTRDPNKRGNGEDG